MTSLTLSKKLYDLGFRGESEQCWHNGNLSKAIGGGLWELQSDIYTPIICTGCKESHDISAYSTDELLGYLPDATYIKKIGKEYEAWTPIDEDLDSVESEADTPSNTLASLLIRLIEEGIVSV